MIGDAAAALDPITSQELVNALSTPLVAAGAILSSQGVTQEAASVYSDAVTAAFANFERGRSRAYGILDHNCSHDGRASINPSLC